MLRKLLKYEFIFNVRLLGVLNIAILVMGILAGIFGRQAASLVAEDVAFTGNFWPFIISLILFSFLIIASVIITVIMIIKRYYDNIIGQEAYLTHTLPVPTWMHVLAKTISALTWELINVVVILVSGALLFLVSGVTGIIAEEMSQNGMNLSELWQELGIPGSTWALLLISVVIQLLRIVLMFYAAITIGSIAAKHRGLCSVGVFILIAIVINVVNGILTEIPGIANAGNLFSVIAVTTYENAIDNTLNVSVTSNPLFAETIVIDLIFSAVLFVITTVSLKKKLNLA